jgi:hypothetical protein
MLTQHITIMMNAMMPSTVAIQNPTPPRYINMPEKFDGEENATESAGAAIATSLKIALSRTEVRRLAQRREEQ